jgi:hypothetical protein
MEDCNTFEHFSAVISPELAALNLNAQKESRVLTGLYALAQEAVENERKRQWVIEQLRQLGPRLKKYGQLEAAMKNCQKFLEKALKLCSQLPTSPERLSPVFPFLLEDVKDMLDDARQNLENSRRYIVGFEIPIVTRMPTKLKQVVMSEMAKSPAEELMKEWTKTRGRATYISAGSFEEWVENMGGTAIYGFPDIPQTGPLKHLRATAADHLLIVQADSFLSKNTRATFPLRLRIIVRLFLAAFGETVERGKVKSVLVQPKNKSVKTRT